ncbi:MAG TPA: PHP domain-containing protein, partial [Burkholderiales bacterium]|nr:PHP domain-containing protein [Burkholderiales bacterium]
MPAPSFVHLRLHSEFSIVDGIVRIDEAVAKAAAEGMPALGLTDLGNVFALVKFYQAARTRGVKPVIGCDAWVESRRGAPQRILLLSQNHDGYLRLARLLTRGFREKGGRAELRKAWLSEEGTEGLIALSGGKWGEVGEALCSGNFEQAKALALEWAQLFPNRFYLELQRGRDPNSESLVRRSVHLASSLAIPVVATHPVQFLEADDFKAHETRVCIAGGYLLNDSRRPRPFTPEDYFKSAREMEALFADLPAALENTVEIAKRCNLELELGINRLPACP